MKKDFQTYVYANLLFAVVSFGIYTLPLSAEEQDPLPGHSHQGAAFDEGPRQFSKLRPGNGDLKFAEDSCDDEAQAFINQGIGQMHGFLNFEAERSFRQAAYVDQSCAMAYWGMALANTIWAPNHRRASEFLALAKKNISTKNSDREKKYIAALDTIRSDASGANFARGLKNIIQAYPADPDAKAFYIVVVWSMRLLDVMGYPGNTTREKHGPLYQMALSILKDHPYHPAHHYIVHLWDNADFKYALDSADRLGFSAPTVAHMWHMAGHTYNQANLLFERWWSQEAAARVDHKYMAEDKVFPFWLHNHAHNNEWYSRTLQDLGNFGKSLQVAGNLLAQPTHPKFNQPNQYQHVQTGSLRMLEVIERGEYWQLGDKLFASPLLACGQFKASAPDIYGKCLRTKNLTALFMGRSPSQTDINIMDEAHAKEIKLVAKLQQGSGSGATIRELAGLSHLQSTWGLFSLAHYCTMAKSCDAVKNRAASAMNAATNTPALLAAAAVMFQTGDQTRGNQFLDKAKKYSQEIDFSAPSLKRMSKTFKELGVMVDASWKVQFSGWRAIHASRPTQESLGPLLWKLFKMPNIKFVDDLGDSRSLVSAMNGKPAIVVYTLASCPHCDVQVAALEAKRAALAAKGVELVSIRHKPDNDAAFREAKIFDEFEDLPMHGLFILNESQEIVWQDVSAEAFLDIDFLMNEVDRALNPLTKLGFEGQLVQLN